MTEGWTTASGVLRSNATHDISPGPAAVDEARKRIIDVDHAINVLKGLVVIAVYPELGPLATCGLGKTAIRTLNGRSTVKSFDSSSA